MDLELYTELSRDVFQAKTASPRDSWGAVTFLAESGLYAGFLYLAATATPFGFWYWTAQVLLGFSLFRFFVLTHECGHSTLFVTRWMNTLVGTLTGCVSLMPFLVWRDLHHLHHRWVGVVDKDPTMASVLELNEKTELQRRILTIFWYLHLPLASGHVFVHIFWLGPFKRNFFCGSSWRHRFSVALTLLPISAAMYLIGFYNVLYLYAPALCVYLWWFETLNLAHHTGLCKHTSDSHPNPFPLREQEKFTRTTLLPGFLNCILAYNFSYHTEHHLFPQVPWYDLPRIRALCSRKVTHYQQVALLGITRELRSNDPFAEFVDPMRPSTGS